MRGLLYEFGVVVPMGWRALLAQAGPLLAEPTACPVPELLRGELLEQLRGITHATARIAELRTADCELATAGAGVSADRGDPRCRAADGDRGGGERGGCEELPFGSGVRRLPGPGATAVGDRRPGQVVGDQQAR